MWLLSTRCDVLLRFALSLLIVLILGLSIFSRRGWIDWIRISRSNSDLEAQVKGSETKKQELRLKIARFNDAAEQEFLIRQQLGYLKSSEILIEFD